MADEYTTVDLRTGLLFDSWSLELYGKNVTDEHGINDIARTGHIPERRRGHRNDPPADGRPFRRFPVLTGRRTGSRVGSS